MTVVVAVACADGTVVMGGDSFCGDETLLNLCKAHKVYKVGPVGVGICGWVRSEQIFERTLKFFIPEKKHITEDWLRNELTDHIHDAMKEHGILQEKEGIHEMKESSYLLAHNGTIYHFDEDFSLWDSQRPISAIGAGRTLAIGAMSALLRERMRQVSHKRLEHLALHNEDPGPEKEVNEVIDVSLARNMVGLALEVCADWSPWVCPPFQIIEIPPEEADDE